MGFTLAKPTIPSANSAPRVGTALAATAAKESADATKKTVDHIPRIERAYVFLGLDYKATFKDFAMGYAGDTSKHSILEFGFKNHGKTPAIVEGIYATAGYWPGPHWPSMALAGGQPIQKGFAIRRFAGRFLTFAARRLFLFRPINTGLNLFRISANEALQRFPKGHVQLEWRQ